MAKVSTIVQLEVAQKERLEQLAKDRKTSRNALVRDAVDQLLNGGMSAEEYTQLEVLTDAAQKSIALMSNTVDKMNEDITKTIEEIEAMRKEAKNGRQ